MTRKKKKITLEITGLQIIETNDNTNTSFSNQIKKRNWRGIKDMRPS